MFSRSSLSSWSVGSQEAALQDVDYISFLFSTLTGFSSERLASLQEEEDDCLPPSPLSPLSLYPTPLEQFTHQWDIVEVCLQRTIFLPTTVVTDLEWILKTWMKHSEVSHRDRVRVKGRGREDNVWKWKVLIFWTQQWSFSPFGPSLSLL